MGFSVAVMITALEDALKKLNSCVLKWIIHRPLSTVFIWTTFCHRNSLFSHVVLSEATKWMCSLSRSQLNKQISFQYSGYGLLSAVLDSRTTVQTKMEQTRRQSSQPWSRQPNQRCTRQELTDFNIHCLFHSPFWWLSDFCFLYSTKWEPTSRWNLPRPVKGRSNQWWTQQGMWVSAIS